jgi:hypothetical protein
MLKPAGLPCTLIGTAGAVPGIAQSLAVTGPCTLKLKACKVALADAINDSLATLIWNGYEPAVRPAGTPTARFSKLSLGYSTWFPVNVHDTPAGNPEQLVVKGGIPTTTRGKMDVPGESI